MYTTNSSLVFLFFSVCVCVVFAQPELPRFVDKTATSGLPDIFAFKYGGPVIADIDGDGWSDVILNEHFLGHLHVYRRVPGRSFNLTYRHPSRGDWHGIATYDFQGSGRQDLLIGTGGAFGFTPAAPTIFESRAGSPAFERILESSYGFDQYKGRLRAIRFIDLDLDGDLDVLITAAGAIDVPEPMPPGELVFYENTGAESWKLYKTLFNADCPTSVLTTDIDNDQILDMICGESRSLRVFRGTGSFPVPFTDVSNTWLAGMSFPRIAAYYDYMTELDYNNDGRMDIYVTCGNNFTLGACDDILLKNTGTKFIDVTNEARLPVGGIHQEPAVGDFNLDGFVDLLIPTYGTLTEATPNILMLNMGDGTFKTLTLHGINVDPSLGFRGAGASSVLMGRGGRLHVIVGYEGGIPGVGGPWKYYQNISAKKGNMFLALKVLDIPDLNLVARGARVTIKVGSLTMTRRVGNDGGESQSLPDRVHFGLGMAATIDSVTIRYVGGVTRRQFNVSAGFQSSPSE